MSMWEPFTEDARRSIVLAQDVAARAGSGTIDTGHIVCGILEIDESPLLPLFEERGLNIDAFRERVMRAAASSPTSAEMIFTPEAKRMIESAFEEARAAGVDFIGPEVLIAGLTREPAFTASKHLVALGFDLTIVRERMLLQARTPAIRPPGGIESLRRSYLRAELGDSDLSSDPIVQLRRWITDAQTSGNVEPNAMAVSTAASDGQPSTRMVLLRALDDRGLVFYTSYSSRKGRELQANPRASALFYWAGMERQVRIEGTVQTVSDDESDAYFASRPRGHQLAAWASEQSEPVESRALLDQRIEDYGARFEGEEVPRPHSWGGYVLRPERFEFWQGRNNRMHDRLEFIKDGNTWKQRRLSP